MKLNKNLLFVVALITTFTLSSCRSYEESVINKLENLSDRVDKKSKDFDIKDWEKVFKDFADIHEKMEDCEFTQKQLKEVGRLEGRLSATIIREGAQAIGQSFSGAIEGISSLIKGIKQGVEENKDEYEDALKELIDTFKSLDIDLEDD